MPSRYERRSRVSRGKRACGSLRHLKYVERDAMPSSVSCWVTDNFHSSAIFSKALKPAGPLASGDGKDGGCGISTGIAIGEPPAPSLHIDTYNLKSRFRLFACRIETVQTERRAVPLH